MACDRTTKLYLMRLQDHLRMLKRRRRAVNGWVTRDGLTMERIDTTFELMHNIAFMEQWISEVKRSKY